MFAIAKFKVESCIDFQFMLFETFCLLYFTSLIREGFPKKSFEYDSHFKNLEERIANYFAELHSICIGS